MTLFIAEILDLKVKNDIYFAGILDTASPVKNDSLKNRSSKNDSLKNRSLKKGITKKSRSVAGFFYKTSN